MSILMQLVWREANELMRPVLALMAITAFVPLTVLSVNDVSDFSFAVFGTCLAYPVIAGTLLGMRAAAGDRDANVAQFVAAMPIQTRVLAAVRLVSSTVAIALPILGLYFVASVARVSGNWEQNVLGVNRLHASAFVIALQWMLIVATVGTGRLTELRAASYGLAVLVAWWSLSATVSNYIAQNELLAPLCNFAHYLGPAYMLLFGPVETNSVAIGGGAVVAMMISIGCLTVAFVRRYDRGLSIAVNGDFPSPLSGWRLRPNCAVRQIVASSSRPRFALLQKELRDVATLGLPVLSVAAIWCIAVIFPNVLQQANLWNDPLLHGLRFFALESTEVAILPTTIALAVLLGIGQFLREVTPGVNEFWRSRPIDVRQWFWTKYTLGLACVLATCIAFAVYIAINDGYLPQPLGWLVPCAALVYTFCAMATLLVRQAMFAGILGLGATVVIYSVIVIPQGTVPNKWLTAILILIATAGSTVVASRAAANDWVADI